MVKLHIFECWSVQLNYFIKVVLYSASYFAFFDVPSHTFFVWQHGTKVVRRYIHLSGKDVDNVLLSLNERGGQIKPEKYKLKSLICKRCSESISIGMNFCSKCALPINLNDEYTREMELENENKSLKVELTSIREEMNQQFTKIMSMIQHNPKLAQVKPTVLVEKTME